MTHDVRSVVDGVEGAPPLDGAALDALLAYWEAANYLRVAQIYLRENPLLREPLRAEHVKPRLLGHWGTSPGLNLVYAQLNRLIRATGQQVLYVACIGDVPTQETVAASALLREHVPELRFRVVNVVDLMAIAPREVHPHGMARQQFETLFGETTDVVCAFHGYARALHQLLHGRPNAGRFHVHGYSEQGTTTTPFDMVVLNECSRYHLVLNALRRGTPHRPRGTCAGAPLRGDARAPSRLHPRALRGHARGARLDLAGAALTRSPCGSSSSTRLQQPEARPRRPGATRRSCAEARSAGSPTRRPGATPRLSGALADAGGEADAVGHRVVHGGSRFDGPARVDDDARAAIAALAPLHTRAALKGIDAVAAALPGLPQVACFDTAFHRTLAPEAATYALPREWNERFGLRRYGFHGLNVSWCHEQAARALGSERCGRLVVCHLGSGCSVSAVLDGRSVDTTMGFTPLEGRADGNTLEIGRSGPAAVPAGVRHRARRPRPRAEPPLGPARHHRPSRAARGRGRHGRRRRARTTRLRHPRARRAVRQP